MIEAEAEAKASLGELGLRMIFTRRHGKAKATVRARKMIVACGDQGQGAQVQEWIQRGAAPTSNAMHRQREERGAEVDQESRETHHGIRF